MSNTIDLTGQNFGYWTVLFRSDKKAKSRQVYWHCRCICGNEKDVCGGNLRNGSSTNCGCKRIGKRKDITGQQFGRLIAIEPTEQKSQQNIIWKCQCQCGNITYVPLASLMSGNTKSCGCLHKELLHEIMVPKLIGQKFHHLTVLQEAGIDKNGKQLWECECDCINKTHIITTTTQLTTGNTQSCGCQKSIGEETIKTLLLNNKIKFIQQKTFSTCRFNTTNALAKFDFYVNDSYLIEYDGIQHFKYNNRGWSTEEHLIYVQEHDTYKTQWCKDNNIPLIRIPYWHLPDLCIEDLSLETSQFIT